MSTVKAILEEETTVKTKDVKAFGTNAAESPLKQISNQRREVLL